MKMTFRWYGDNDPVTLEKIRQIPGMTGIVSAIYDIPVGEVWPMDRILELKQKIKRFYIVSYRSYLAEYDTEPSFFHNLALI